MVVQAGRSPYSKMRGPICVPLAGLHGLQPARAQLQQTPRDDYLRCYDASGCQDTPAQSWRSAERAPLSRHRCRAGTCASSHALTQQPRGLPVAVVPSPRARAAIVDRFPCAVPLCKAAQQRCRRLLPRQDFFLGHLLGVQGSARSAPLAPFSILAQFPSHVRDINHSL